jgi:hypothetical protein
MFKVGDRVKVLSPESIQGLGTIVDTERNGIYPIKVNLDRGYYYIFKAHELEHCLNGVEAMIECLK